MVTKCAKLVNLNNNIARCGTCSRLERCIGYGMDRGDTNSVPDIGGRRKLYRQGDILFREGDHFQYLYAVHSGAVKTFRTTLQGERQIIDFYLPGDIVGLEAITDDQYACEATALNTTNICMIDYQSFVETSLRHPSLYKGFLKRLSAQIRREEENLVSLGSRDAYQRIARLIARLSNYYSETGYSSTEFTLPMSRTDIASHLGLAVETVSRQLGHLRENGIVDIRQNEVSVRELQSLNDIAGFCVRETQPTVRPEETLHG
jgi:CRP/FNR family transcriptional regulator